MLSDDFSSLMVLQKRPIQYALRVRSGPRVRQDDWNPLKSSLAIIPVRVLKPLSPTNVCEEQFIADSPQDQPKRAELNDF